MEADAEKADSDRERLRDAIRTHEERAHRPSLTDWWGTAVLTQPATGSAQAAAAPDPQAH
jgi:hypothetical protein